MKKISFALITVGLIASLSVSAALPAEAQSFQFVIPNLKGGIEITLESLYLRPSNSQLDNAILQTSSVDVGSDVVSVNNSAEVMEPEYNFGFRVGLGYMFPNSGNDIQIAWTSYSHTTSDTIKVPDLTQITSPLFNASTDTGSIQINSASQRFDGPFNSVYGFSTGMVSNAKFGLNSIDLNVGQYADVGTRLRMRMFGGLHFAQVTSYQTADVEAFGSVSNEEDGHLFVIDYINDDFDQQFSSEFNGVGPQFGIETSYHIGNCFGVTAYAAAALLVGDTESSSMSRNTFSAVVTEFVDGVVVDSDVLVEPTNTELHLNSDDSTRIVPAFDARLGVNWSYIFTNQSVVTLEGGYQWTQYINVVDTLTTDDSGNVVIRTTGSVGFDGPYLTLNWHV